METTHKFTPDPRMSETDSQLPVIASPPAYCQYTGGLCDQAFSQLEHADGVFLYPSRPPQIAAAIEGAADRLRAIRPQQRWLTWRDFSIDGQVIFCEIDKALRLASTVICDVTTLNFNLLFEIGFAVGLGLPVLLIRDSTYIRDEAEFAALGVLDTIGYHDFTNGDQLADDLVGILPARPLPPPQGRLYLESPLYVLPGPIATQGTVRLLSVLKKSELRFRTYDAIEKPRVSLQEARRQVHGSIGVVAHLLSPNREGATVHNALCALIAGIGMATGKVVLLLQEEDAPQPIDYRDVVKQYDNPDSIPALLEEPIHQVVRNMQRVNPRRLLPPETALERIDLGDTAAENEISGLRDYFVRTGQFRQAVRGRARLVVGRKGTGKTAIFYEVRDAVWGTRARLVLDLRPEGHQFKKFEEGILTNVSPGVQEHTVTAFWNYVLLAELAHKILEREADAAYRDPELLSRYKNLEDQYYAHSLTYGDDLSQRLLRQVDRLIERVGAAGIEQLSANVTEVVFGGDIKKLDDAVGDFLQDDKEEVWILVDNLDKGWPIHGSTETQILVLRGFLEATRKLQRQLERRGVELKCLVFIRTDIYEHLLRETPDKGKDTIIRLDWDDTAVFQEIVKRRIAVSTEVVGEFRDVWQAFFDAHIGTRDSFSYILDRTFMRPRDVLLFIQNTLEVALNRGHARVTTEDIRHAESAFSQDMLVATASEIRDTRREVAGVVYGFLGARRTLTRAEFATALSTAGVAGDAHDDVLELLVWFGFLGVTGPAPDDETYAYQVRYDVKQLLLPFIEGRARLVVHPAFRSALSINDR